jgi:ABC-type phosphate transport system substrate-binding protein
VEGNPGVAEAVAHIPFSVGYIERSYSNGPTLFDAAIRNQAGNYVTPTAADAAQKSEITPTDSDDFTWRDCRGHLRETPAVCPPAAHRADFRLAAPHPWVDNALPNC